MNNKVELNSNKEFLDFLESTLESCNGKLLIVSDNIFITSRVNKILKCTDLVEHKEDSSSPTESVFYNDGARVVNKSLTDSKGIYSNPVVDNNYYVVTLNALPDSSDVSYEIRKAEPEPVLRRDDNNKKESHVSSDDLKKNAKIRECIYTYNVLFVEDINESNISVVRDSKDRIVVVTDSNYNTDELRDSDVIVISCKHSSDVSIPYDILQQLFSKGDCQIVCDMTWVNYLNILFQSPFMPDVKSTYIYNESLRGESELGNESLYETDEDNVWSL